MLSNAKMDLFAVSLMLSSTAWVGFLAVSDWFLSMDSVTFAGANRSQEVEGGFFLAGAQRIKQELSSPHSRKQKHENRTLWASLPQNRQETTIWD